MTPLFKCPSHSVAVVVIVIVLNFHIFHIKQTHHKLDSAQLKINREQKMKLITDNKNKMTDMYRVTRQRKTKKKKNKQRIKMCIYIHWKWVLCVMKRMIELASK